jgi:hypothetical protein
LATAVAAVFLATLAGTARADNSSDAAAVADKFVVALLTDDPSTACSLLSPRVLNKLGGAAQCPDRLFPDSSASDDYDALDTLSKAFAAARKSSASRRGDFVRKHFTVRNLARAMEQIDSDLTVKVGKSPRAAAGQLATTAVLDTRTTARRVVIYAEGDSGTIYRVTGTAFSDPSLKKVAQGLPEAPKPAPAPQPLPPTLTHTVDSVAFATNGTAYAQVSVADSRAPDQAMSFLVVLVPGATGYVVDDALVSLVSILALAGSDSGSGGIVIVGP